MPWTSSKNVMPETWWDAIREKDRLPSWLQDLVTWIDTRGPWSHMDTLTFRRAHVSPYAAGKAYCRYLAEHASSWMLTDVLWAVEQHPGGHGSHIHALWKTPYDRVVSSWKASSRPFESSRVQALVAKPPPKLYKLAQAASARYVGFSRLWPIEEQKRAVISYTLKYVLKGLKGLNNPPPMPWEPTPKEPVWGMETYP